MVFFAFVSNYDWIFKDQGTNIISYFFFQLFVVGFFGHTYLYSSTAENPTQTTIFLIRKLTDWSL